MKHECEIVRDLMPMCIDGTASEKTKQMVDEHVEECPPCSGVYAEMKGEAKLALPVQNASPEFVTTVKKMKSRRQRRTWLTLLLGVVLAGLVALLGVHGYYWYYVQEVIVSPDALCFVQSMDGIAMVEATSIPKDAEMEMIVYQHDRDGDGAANYEMYLYLTATRAEMQKSGPTSFHFVFGTSKNGKVFMSNGGAAPVEIEQIIHGTPDQGGTIVYVGAGMKVTGLHGLTIKSPEITWRGTSRLNVYQDNMLVTSTDAATSLQP